MRIARTLEEAESLPDMNVDLSQPPSGDLDQAHQEEAGGRGRKTQQRKGVKELEGRHKGADTEEAKCQLGVACKELKAFDMDVAEHAMLRTKQMYYVGGDKAGRLRAHRLRAQATQCRVNEIQTQNGATVTKDGLILQEF
ncbi:hypothetical protein NDU88_006846 [Pleurodeles waltl]|uniref:Uncharacterized protein n=1 Tax=Pleurodeles waltl TaxID=8319 RepID=A0AAV7VRT1_PLEWA|nr:hypothetical protein NDU88_006846 [Pleurodeles waltl]